MKPLAVEPVSRDVGEVAVLLLKLTYESTDDFPPLKCIVGCALHINELVKVCIQHDYFMSTPENMM